MLQKLKKLLGIGAGPAFRQLVAEGAQIIDVRTRGEYHAGHLAGSVNIPVHELPNRLPDVSKDKNIIVCCASGARSGAARDILTSHGFRRVYNGGGWRSLQDTLET